MIARFQKKINTNSHGLLLAEARQSSKAQVYSQAVDSDVDIKNGISFR